MLKLITIVGTRPEIIRLSEIIKKCDKYFKHKLIFTNQNFSDNLSKVFFKDLKIRKPNYIYKIKNSSFGNFYGNVLIETEKIVKKENPDALLILGDTNSAISSLIFKRMGIPVFHLEAGNRSFDNNVPEELNRKIVDTISDFNLVYTESARLNLLLNNHEPRKVILIGSPMNEVINNNLNNINKSKILSKLKLEKNNYFLISLHREENVDHEENLKLLSETIVHLKNKYKKKVVITNHPRFNQKNKLLKNKENIILTEPLGYLDYMKLQLNSFCVLSDSGTIAEESSILKFDAVCIRNSMERPEAIENGNIILCGLNKENIDNSVLLTKEISSKKFTVPNDYQIKNTSDRVVKIIQGLTFVKNHWYNIKK